MTKTFALIEEEIEVADYDKKVVVLEQVENVVSVNELLEKVALKNRLIDELRQRIDGYLAEITEMETDINDIKNSTGIM